MAVLTDEHPFLSPPRKIVATSMIVGLIFSLLAGFTSLAVMNYKRDARLDYLASDLSAYLHNYLDELSRVTSKLQPLTQQPCVAVASHLTASAAFNLSVRALLLVRLGSAFCSSATGPMDYPVSRLAPGIDQHKSIDMAIVPETPLMPGKPAIALWFAAPGNPGDGIFTTLNVNLTPYLLFTAREREVTGIAIVVDSHALSTFDPALKPVAQLGTPARIVSVPGYSPITLWLFSEKWGTETLQFALLTGLLAGLLSALLYAWFLSIRFGAGREILTGIKRNQFSVVYQPVFDTASRQLRGVEALMRWHHPAAGSIRPDIFINYAEAQGLIVPLTRHLFTLIVRDLPLLQKCLPAGAKLGINLAPAHLKEASFCQDILHFSRQLPARQFKLLLEMTERAMLDGDEVQACFRWLHEQGFEIAIDDFGTGHSALIYLERFQFDYLKIDKGFINAIGQETITTPVLDAVLTLARRLKMETVAEGVETAEQAKWLAAHGVTYMQGFYLGRPMSPVQLNEWYCKLPEQ